MPLNPILYTDKVVGDFLRYQLTTYAFADERLYGQPRELVVARSDAGDAVAQGAVRQPVAGLPHRRRRERPGRRGRVAPVHAQPDPVPAPVRASGEGDPRHRRRQDDADLDRHRIGQDRVLSLPGDQSLSRAARRRRGRDRGGVRLPDERLGIQVSGKTQPYVRGTAIDFHFCPACGGIAFWRAQQTGDDGRRRIAVNLRLAEPEAVATIPVDHFDGLDTFDDLPRDGRCVAGLLVLAPPPARDFGRRCVRRHTLIQTVAAADASRAAGSRGTSKSARIGELRY